MKGVSSRSVLTLGLAVVLFGATAGNASAATRIGSDLEPAPINAGVCSPPTGACTAMNSTLPGEPLTSPIDGVVVRWRVRAVLTNTGGNDARLKVLRAVSGGWLAVNTSTTATISGAGTHVFDTRQAIEAGDQVAIDVDEPNNNLVINTGNQMGVTFVRWQPPLDDGDDGPPTTTFPNGNETLINADVEADADGDGFGDESQDQCPGQAGPVNGCPGPSPGALTLDLTAKKQGLSKKVKFFATATAASTLTAEGKKIKETTQQLAANQETKIKAKLKRKALNRLEEKGKGKVKIEATASDQSGVAATDTVKVKVKD